MSSINFRLFPIYHYNELDSTQLEAKRFIDTNSGLNHGAIILSNHQTSGYGKYGRVWNSSHGNLAASIILRKQIITSLLLNHNIAQLCFVAVLAIGQAILKEYDKSRLLVNHTSYPQQKHSKENSLTPLLSNHNSDIALKLGYKWVNDIMINNLKVSGILIEIFKDFIILGIGVNLNNSPQHFPSTCLAEHGIVINPSDFLMLILEGIEPLISEWHTFGFTPIRQQWLKMALYINKIITITKPCFHLQHNTQEHITGIFLGITENGSAILREPSRSLEQSAKPKDIIIEIGDMSN